MSRRRRRKPTGRVPGVPYPSTEKSRAHSRVAGWKTGKYARVVTFAEVLEQRISMIESGRIGTGAERDEVRRLVQAFEAAEEFTLERIQRGMDLRGFVLAVSKAARERSQN